MHIGLFSHFVKQEFFLGGPNMKKHKLLSGLCCMLIISGICVIPILASEVRFQKSDDKYYIDYYNDDGYRDTRFVFFTQTQLTPCQEIIDEVGNSITYYQDENGELHKDYIEKCGVLCKNPWSDENIVKEQVHKYRYDQSTENNTKIVYEDYYSNGEYQGTGETIYTYDDNGNMVSQYRGNSDTSLYIQYGETGNIAYKKYCLDNSISEYFYNIEGDEIKRIIDNELIQEYTYDYTYNEMNRVERKRRYNQEGDIVSTALNIYTDNEDGSYQIMVVGGDNHVEQYIYDSIGNLIIQQQLTKISQYDYDYGELQSETDYYSPGSLQVTDNDSIILYELDYCYNYNYEYDDHHNIIGCSSIKSDGTVTKIDDQSIENLKYQ